MTTTRLSPMASAPEPGGRRRWTIGVSLLLHILVVAALLGVAGRVVDDTAIAPSYELLFEGSGGNTPPTAPQRGDEGLPQQQPAPMPAPDSDAAAPQPDSMAGPETPPPTAPAIPDAAPPARAEPSASQPPEVRLESPAAPPPASLALPPASLAPGLALPTPPIPPPPAARLRPMAPPSANLRPMTPPPPPSTGTFEHPMSLNFNPAPYRQPAPRTTAARGSVASRSVDLSTGAPKPGPNRNEAFFDIRAANIGADWAQGLKAYWLRHRYYPPQAAENGEDGSVDIELTVNRLGRVESVAVKSRSGSPWLDMAAAATWRNAQLAPLPAETAGERITVPITINYLLIR